MKRHNPQISVPAIGHVLIIRKDLVYEVSVHTEIHPVPGGILPCSAHFMTAQNHVYIAVSADQLCPHGGAVVVSSKPVILSVEAIAGRNTRVVEIFIRMGDEDDLFIGITLDYLCSPGQHRVPGIEFEHQNQKGLPVDGDHTVEILIAVRGKTV